MLCILFDGRDLSVIIPPFVFSNGCDDSLPLAVCFLTRSALEKDPRPGPLFEGNPVGEGEGSAETGRSGPSARENGRRLPNGPQLRFLLWVRT